MIFAEILLSGTIVEVLNESLTHLQAALKQWSNLRKAEMAKDVLVWGAVVADVLWAHDVAVSAVLLEKNREEEGGVL